MKKIIACCFIGFALTACGWHLRGSIELPKNISQLYVSAKDSKGALVTELRQLIKTNRISLVDSSSDANYSIYILDEKKDRRTAGVGGDALSSSYEITLKAEYEIQIKNSADAVTSTAISVRSFNYNTAAINSATQEELLLDQEMRRDLAQQMLRRVTALAAVPVTAPKAEAAPATAEPNTENKTNGTSGEPVNGKTAP